jgi:transcription-repair coupling factor (superfamily II helicase)
MDQFIRVVCLYPEGCFAGARHSKGEAVDGMSSFNALFEGIRERSHGPFSGLHGALAGLVLAGLSDLPQVTLVIVPGLERARQLVEETDTWLGGNSPLVALFPPDRDSIYNQTAVDAEIQLARLKAMGMGSRGRGVVIVPVDSLCERFFSPRAWAASALTITRGTPIAREGLTRNLAALGYRREHLVEQPGTFAVRGSLVDVYPIDAPLPLRLDFFGDELETLKTFSPQTQRTLEKLTEYRILPALEVLLTSDQTEAVADRLEQAADTAGGTRAELLQRRKERLLGAPDSRDYRELLPFWELADGFLWEFFSSPVVLVEAADQCVEAIQQNHRQQVTLFSRLGELTPLLEPEKYYHPPEVLAAGLGSLQPRAFSRFRDPSPDPAGTVFQVDPVPPPTDPTRETLLTDLKRWLADAWSVVLVVGDQQRFHALKSLLGERRFPLRSSPDPRRFHSGGILMVNGTINQGFLSSFHRLVILGEQDLFPRSRPEPKTRRTAAAADWTISQLVPGDLVVHVDHGVAEYRGIQTMTAGAIEKEFLLLQYAGADRLYVPTDQVHKVQKYIGMEGVRPTIHSLNSKVWETQKRRTRKNVEDIARELLELYAKRQAGGGFAFQADCDLQRDMESRFPYVETPDQMTAIEAVKEDMETGLPMDRLVCGDVGYGKTEVAIRSAFKAVCSGKQVGVLAPTTLLAFQHQQTFSQRLAAFPVRVAMVSRLVPLKEQKAILQKVKDGVIDVLIGTHRLLSNEIAFKDLGLLVVDEEHRFGVKHKERLKAMRSNIDVLTLTATPIPRTLHMALSGIRQISIIDTPPPDRRPIQTFVAPFDASWVKRAILEELKRGGQIFYVYNRVEFIEKKAAFLRELVPEARVVTAHGQMEERQVEKTMLAFIRREFDILLATTIIESGLDIPNANTLIVDEAERLGLAQMYQLRGRVGRSNRQAVSYFFYSKGKRLTQEAYERLATIEEHTALGSGFKVAMRDLQIRGAGNILGSEQSGHIAAVGLALYIQLLEEAVSAMKGETVRKIRESTIEIPITALFPKSYIHEEETRIELYARLARCNDAKVLELLRLECEDRFGRLPKEAEKLFQVAGLRVAAARAGVVKITHQQFRLRFEFDESCVPELPALIDARMGFFRRLSFLPDDPLAVFLSLEQVDRNEVIGFAEKFLQTLGEVH